ncbi:MULTISPECIES: hypothetical protein [Sphingobacterium]|nr:MULTISPECIES: hypothetical protein [Sphingobacterium]
MEISRLFPTQRSPVYNKTIPLAFFSVNGMGWHCWIFLTGMLEA